LFTALDTSIFHDFAERPKTKKKKGKKGGDEDDAPARSYVVADDDDMPTGVKGGMALWGF
jgi:hypothetical protein